jgi:hypothetical protein
MNVGVRNVSSHPMSLLTDRRDMEALLDAAPALAKVA